MGLIKRAILLVVAGSFIIGCSDKESQEMPAPHTGNVLFEQEIAPDAKHSVRFFNFQAQKFYVSTSRLNVRSSAEVLADNLVGALGLNDEVLILSDVPGTVFVSIKIVKTSEEIMPSEFYYVSKDYLSTQKNDELAEAPRSRFFMVQNIATEKMRVYQKQCDDGNCAHKMILEADIAVGEKTKSGDTMTVLGNFNVTRWYKFYEDGGGRYPSWYDPSYPPVPKPNSSMMSWASGKVLPTKAAKVRGAFGWFTAHVGPNNYSQWTHGTLGWGADKTKFIDITRKFFANLFADPRSHGCSRTDNETIAFVRELIDTGAPIIKVYALEALADADRKNYIEKTQTWDYILTKNGVRVDGEKADRDEVLKRGTSRELWLEEGQYVADVYPNPEKFKTGAGGAKSGKNGNVYGLKQEDMRGVFLVDVGLLQDYEHPADLTVGGYGRNSFPGFIKAKVRLGYALP